MDKALDGLEFDCTNRDSRCVERSAALRRSPFGDSVLEGIANQMWSEVAPTLGGSSLAVLQSTFCSSSFVLHSNRTWNLAFRLLVGQRKVARFEYDCFSPKID